MSEGESARALRPDLRIGSYRLVQALGSGGMSSVFRAIHDDTGHEVAVKVLPRNLAKNPTLLQRFLREAKSAEALEHPHIVSIFDRGVDQGRHYLVLEYVEGGDFHDYIREHGPLEIAEAMTVVKKVAEGLLYAAGQGLIHRDIKPANLLRAPNGEVKIIDLGLALQSENEDERVTRVGTTVGTVDYMAPEQARDSRATSIRSDIYSLGCTFYYLLTGAPPFPGGNIAEKLTRHCTQPPPDPRALRPEASEPLAKLVLRMMAKRPESRFYDYADLIAALDALSGAPPEPALLDALVVDEEDDSDDAIELTLAAPDSEPGLAPLSDERPRPNYSLAELAELDDEPTPRAPARRPPSAAAIQTPLTRDHRRAAPAPPPLANALIDDEDSEEVEGKIVGPPPASAYGGMDPATKKWMKTLVGAGIALLLLIVGIDQLIKSASAPQSGPVVESDGPEENATSEKPVVPLAPEPLPVRKTTSVATTQKPSVSSATTIKPAVPTVAITNKEAPKAALPPAVPWAEPADPRVESVPEPSYSALIEDQFLPAWGKSAIPDQLGTSQAVVSRIIDPGNANHKNSLRGAFELPGGTVELTDDGPFGEDDLRIRGDARLVKAAPGRRPIVKIEAPKLDVVREQPAVFVLDGEQLILDGLDLIVNVQDLPRSQDALFLCQGATLTLRNCTVTVANPNATPFALVKARGARPSRVRLESTLVRGPVLSILDVSEANVDFLANRSLLIGGQGPLFRTEGVDPRAERRVYLTRSVLATRGPVFDMEGPPSGGKPAPLTVRALGSSFARLSSQSVDGGTGSLCTVPEEGGGGFEALSWFGDSNTFAGWSDWVSSGGGRPAKVTNLAAARRTWPRTDPRSQELAVPWNPKGNLDRVVPNDFRALAPDRLAVLTRVAAPTPYLFEKSIEAFPRPAAPLIATRLTEPPGPLPRPGTTAAPPGAPGRPKPAPVPVPAKSAGPYAAKVAPAPAPKPEPSPIKDLVFETAGRQWAGDLGAFLRDNVREGDKLARVRVTGWGSFGFTPFRAPVGTSLEIVVAPAAPGVFPTWEPIPNASAAALIEVTGGDLALVGMHLRRETSARLRSLIRVENGHLALFRCRLTSPGIVDPGGGGLIEFRASGTKPLPAPEPTRPGLFQSAVDRPVLRAVESVLISGGDAIVAELGRGFLALTQCAVAATGTAFVLSPGNVARTAFDTDLSLDHCSMTAEKNFVLLGHWPGSSPGPDRPWLVASQDCAYLTSYTPFSRESVLLRIEPNSLAMGTLFWQGNGDAYEANNFAVRSDQLPPPNPYPDVRRQFVGLWGANHFRNVTGPSRQTTASVKLREKLRPGHVEVSDLTLDPDHHPGRSKLTIGADLRRLPAAPAAPRPR